MPEPTSAARPYAAESLPAAVDAVADLVTPPAELLPAEAPPMVEPAEGQSEQETEPARVGIGFIAVYMFTYFGFNLVMQMPALFSLAYKVQVIDSAGKDAGLGLVIGIGGVFGLVLGPVAGVLSDGTRLRWGRRRPWLLVGLALSVLGGLVLALAPNIPAMIAGWAVCSIGVAALSAGWNPILAEQVPSAQRGKLGALGGVSASFSGVGATLLGSFLTGSMLLLFLLPSAVLALGVVLFIVMVKDRPAPAGTVIPSMLDILKSYWFNPRRYPDFALVFLGKSLLQFGFTFFSTYQLYFLLQRLGFTPQEAGRNLALAGGFSLLALMGFAVLGGFLSDRLRRRKPFIYTAAALIAGGLLAAALAPNFVVFVVGGVMLAAGTGAFTSVDLAMATDLLPEKDKAGKYMSIYYLASGLPGTVAAMIAPLIIAIGGGGNYPALFVAGAICAAGTIITTWRIRGVR